MDTKLFINLNFYNSNNVGIETSCNGVNLNSEEEMFLEVASIAFFTLRTMVNLKNKASSKNIATFINSLNASNIINFWKLPHIFKSNIIQLTEFKPEKKFRSWLSINNKLDYKYYADGFGLFATDIENYAPNACYVIIEYFVRKRKNNTEYLNKLLKALSYCAQEFLAGKVTALNQNDYVLGITLVLFENVNLDSLLNNESVSKDHQLDNRADNKLKILEELLNDGVISQEEYTLKVQQMNIKASNLEIQPKRNSKDCDKSEVPNIKKGFYVGIASIFFGSIGIIPLIAIVLSVLGLREYDEDIHFKKWKGYVGLILGVLYLFANAYQNGHV